MKFPMPMGQPGMIKILESLFHGHDAGQELVNIKPVLHAMVRTLAPVVSKELFLLFGGKLKMKNGACQIVSRIDDVQFMFSQTMMLKICLQESILATDPFRPAHLA